LRKEAGADLRAEVMLGLYLTTSRPPTQVETKRAMRLVESLIAEDRVAPELALRYFCLMALNFNQMVYLD
jgi:hypothetical protein